MAEDFLTGLLEDPAVPVSPRRYSITEIETLLRCPARWHYKYNLRLPDPPGPEAEWGIQFHALVEAHYTGQELPSFSDEHQNAWDVFHAAIASHVRPLPGWTERWVEWTLGGVPFHGRIDCVDDQLTVRDTKTKKRRPSQDDIHHSLQLTAYWEAVRQIVGDTPKAVAWDCLIRTKTPVAETYLSDRADRDVSRLTRIVTTALEAADKGYIWPHWGSLGCGSCPFRDRCLTDYH